MAGAGAARPGRAQAGSPSAALKLADQTRMRVERSLPGQVQFVDNLSDSLNTAAGDALYAQALYIMLAVPGALLALGVAYLAALGTSRARPARPRPAARPRRAAARPAGAGGGRERRDRHRRRARRGGDRLRRGAAPGQRRRAPDDRAGAGHRGRQHRAGDPRRGRGAARRHRVGAPPGRSPKEGEARVRGRAAWKRYYLDLVALALSGLIYWLTIRTGFSAVVNPDANPTLSLSVYMFFGPALLWIGATLLLVRLRGAGSSGWPAGRRAADRGSLASFLLASAGRRGAAINRGLVVVGLLLAFGVSLAIFSATYDQQARSTPS